MSEYEEEYGNELGLDQAPGSKERIIKRLIGYAARFKRLFLVALLMLAIAVCTDLAGPLIAKRIIDVHISGIEKPWYETSDSGSYSVLYDGKRYKREDHWAPGETRGGEVRVLQIDRAYYFIASPVAWDGERTVKDGSVIIAKGGQTASYPSKQLNLEELFGFYKPELDGMLKLCLYYLGLVAVSAVFTYGQHYYLQSTANRIIRLMRTDVFAQLNRLPIRYFDNLPAGKVVSRVTNDTETIRDLYVNVLANFFTGTIHMLGIFIALFVLDARLAAICLFIIPALAGWIYVYGRIAKKYNRMIRKTVSDINGMINESIQGMTIIKAFRKEKRVQEQFEVHNTHLFAYQNKLLSLNSWTGYNLVGVIRNTALAALIWYFGGASLSGGEGMVTLGVLYAFVDYLNRLFQPMVNIVNQLPNLERALVSAERVFALVDQEGEDVSDRRIARYKGDVRFEDVFFSYKDNEPVLKGVSFAARQGQTVALVGHTGSGKSSILNLLFRFYDPDRGRITIDGTDTRTLPRQTIRQHMGIVLQDPFLFTGTIGSNVSLGDPAISRERIEKVLADVGAGAMLKDLPLGIDEPVIEKGSTLSAGQRQLISFARALAYDPAILILDEATSNIDTETEAVIQQALDVVKQGRTTFVIAHRLSTVKNADLILVLDRGEIVERGTHEQLMKLEGKYRQMYEIQLGKVAAGQ
ncbi:putative multidrug resistance ABC transporter ATP-binding/permease protein YheH [Paenibacillus konkukensis]|uniref:Multidrug resistance ABC transporter ATP-binding/permease protein YheH n=2 Tax=Paenibacillus konkukensis TaxID=2020716 RepID=A0ABY4RH44_9BACL|nr:putative multidrug resistance ABC transporter ATP-binding/permease protein YheH [Paenibacillus konkukensis]